MYREFWNSRAAVVRSGEGVPAMTLAVGRLHEMVEFLLAQPTGVRRDLSLEGEAVEGALKPEDVAALRRREDFPLVC